MRKRSYQLPERLDSEERKITGAFYTPPEIVDFMAEQLFSGRQFPLRICDFSCGGGAFLAGVLRYARKNFPDSYESCCRNLWGIDINPEALALARKTLPEIPPENFICADTLELDLAEKFDIIIGNPPYRCGGVKNNANFSLARREHLKKAFPNSFEYKMNLFALFIEKAAAMSCEFSLIVPDSLLCGRYFSKLRRYLAEQFRIKGLFLLEKPAFDAAPGNVVILHAAEGASESSGRLKSCRFARGEIEKQPEKDFYFMDQRRFLSESRCRFQLISSAKEEKLLEKLLAPGLRVKDRFSFASGIIARRGKSSIVRSEPGKYSVPAIVAGREINPFEVVPEGFFLELAPGTVKSGLNHERFSGEKIFLRQTGSSLVAAVSREKIYALNNCHVGTALGDFPLDTLAALLNSSVLNYIYRYLSCEGNRNFAQIDIDLLNELPLRRTLEFDRFAVQCRRSPGARRKLDAECARLFGLSASEAAEIRRLSKA